MQPEPSSARFKHGRAIDPAVPFIAKTNRFDVPPEYCLAWCNDFRPEDDQQLTGGKDLIQLTRLPDGRIKREFVTPLGPFMTESPASNTNADVLQATAQKILRLPIENKLEAIEEALIAEAVRLSDGNKSGAARLLGMHRKAVSRRL